MADLLLLRYETPAAARSPELRYSSSCLRAVARRVFGHVEEVRWHSGLEDARVDADAPALVVGHEDVHLGARSLEAMRVALAGGARVVAPDRLASFELDEEVHTLRGFERLEERLLAGPLTPRERRRSHLPVSLVAAPCLAGRSLAALLTDATLLGDEPAVHAGIFHDYVDYYGEVREDVLPYVPVGVADVLEIGCGRGLTGALLQQRRRCRVTGVELNPEVAREAAGRLHKVLVGDVETLAIDGPFDAVVATELFEHLCYPEAFLEKMRTVLRPGGRIVLSVPNVGHGSIVEDLLAGRWDYLPIGLLCYTHFRFFTRRTLASWLERLGFTRFEIVAQTTAPPAQRFARLAEDFEVDLESLRTKGFYVVIEV
jgi:SAM-dependent methyltransferase